MIPEHRKRRGLGAEVNEPQVDPQPHPFDLRRRRKIADANLLPYKSSVQLRVGILAEAADPSWTVACLTAERRET